VNDFLEPDTKYQITGEAKVHFLSYQIEQGLTLRPGDFLAAGTASGVGYAMEPPNFLKPGDKVTCELEGTGQ